MQLQVIIKECKQHKQTAQKCLFNELSMQMFLLCRRYVKSNAIAEELMMNGFVQVFKAITDFVFVDDASTVGWIKKIMLHECLQHLRKNEKLLYVTQDDNTDIILDENIMNKLNTDEIYKAITQLPIGYKTVFNLFVVEGYSHSEIATMLQITIGTSKSQLSRSKLLLQEILLHNNNYHAKSK